MKKSQGLFLDKNKALMEWKKAGLDIIQTGTESDQTEAGAKKTLVDPCRQPMELSQTVPGHIADSPNKE